MRWQVKVHCLHCFDEGMVCEEHPAFPCYDDWGPVEGHGSCGGAGMPCPYCCSEIPMDGTQSIGDAFVPDWKRVQEGQRP